MKDVSQAAWVYVCMYIYIYMSHVSCFVEGIRGVPLIQIMSYEHTENLRVLLPGHLC